MTYPSRVLDEVRPAGALVYPLGEDPVVYSHLRLPYQLAELWVICNTKHFVKKLFKVLT